MLSFFSTKTSISFYSFSAPCVSGGLPKPTNITFSSINMKNILQWRPPEGLLGVEVTYTVLYFMVSEMIVSRFGMTWAHLTASEASQIREWSLCVTNHTLMLSWLEPDTLYCIQVESFVPGPPRLAQPSEKQCVNTLKDQTSALKIKIIFWYVLPTSVIVFIFFVMGFSMYRYIHVGKEKHPANLILIYGNEFDKRFFVPAEKIVINFITLNILEDSKISHKDISVMEKNNDASDLNEPSEDQEPQQEEMEVKRLGYASHLMDIFCDSEKYTKGSSLTQQESLSGTTPTARTVIEYEYDVRTTDICVGPGDQALSLQEVFLQGKLFEQQAALAVTDPQTLLYSYTPQLRDLDHQPQEYVDVEEGPEEELSTTLVDWDPQTGRLCIPSLSSFEHDSEDCEFPEYKELTEEGLLSRLYEKQALDKSLEEDETYLLQFLEEWGLYVQMED
ncbi:Interleukin-20 receptor alpha chain [Pteropus alecto]|uniref:Interleukin-20 receptor alpha chain n=1 Tax=Pteropus alecto TaxID=9402 RepID=L5KDN9_PTEAL|nr:Interleukin-20 receptor alpha chain [Pteropus alecto]